MDEKYYASDINSMKSKTQMVKYCAGQVQAALASDGVEDIDRIKEYQLKLSELHLMLIMITSHQTRIAI